MSVRPVFLYALTAVLVVALGLGCWENITAIRYGQMAESSPTEQEYILSIEKTDMAHFLAEMTEQAETLSVAIDLFTTADMTAEQTYPCQIVAMGAYNDLATWLAWLEKQMCISEIASFVLENGQGEQMRLTVELFLY